MKEGDVKIGDEMTEGQRGKSVYSGLLSPSKRGLSEILLLVDFSYIRNSFENEDFCI